LSGSILFKQVVPEKRALQDLRDRLLKSGPAEAAKPKETEDRENSQETQDACEPEPVKPREAASSSGAPPAEKKSGKPSEAQAEQRTRKSKHVDEPVNVESDEDYVSDIDDDKADSDKQVDDDFAEFGSLMSSAPPALKW